MFTPRRLTRALAGAMAVTAIAAPAAVARPIVDFHDSSSYEPAPTVTRTIEDGFDWGSAAIGAGGAAAVLLLSGAGASAVSHRQRRLRVAR